MLGIAGLSMAGVFYKLASAPPVAMVAWRMLIGAALTAPITFLLQRRKAVSAPFGAADLRLSAVAGVFFCIDLVLWAVSLRYTSVASAALFVSTQPIYVAILASWFFKERPSPAMLGGIALGIGGIILVGAADVKLSGAALIGDGLALAAALAETGYLLIGRNVRRRIDAPRYVLVVYATCAAFCWALLPLTGASAHISAHDMVMALGVALSATVLGHTLVSLSLGYMPAAVVAVSFLAQPTLAGLFALAILHQPIPLSTVLGGAIALAGIGIVAYANERGADATATPLSIEEH